MKNKKTTSHQTTFRRYLRKGYAAFRSIGRQVRIGVLGVAMLSTQQVMAQTVQSTQTTAQATDAEETMNEVTVTGAMPPLAQMQQERIVCVITRNEINRVAAHTVNDLLKTVAGVDVRQRGAFSIQTDISINGGTFDQVTVLLNGVNITNPQTGHHTMDLPVNPSDIERIEILEGASSRVYGTSAFGGAINIVTRTADNRHLSIGASAGSWETVGGEMSLSVPLGVHTQHFMSGGAQRSDGGTTNSDFHRTNAYYHGISKAKRFSLDWQAGLSQKQYGANTFYSPKFPNQWEGNRRYMASVTAEIGLTAQEAGLATPSLILRPSLYWNRAHDHFQLIRGTSTGENRHQTDVVGANLALETKWRAGTTTLTYAMRHERIMSTNLGHPMAQQGRFRFSDSRTQHDIGVQHNIHIRRLTLSTSLLATQNNAIDSRLRFCPGVDLAWQVHQQWRLFASYNKGFRMPTFTDLYYSGAERQGNGSLLPEHTHSLSVGMSYKSRSVRGNARVFYHRGKHMIDWVKLTASDPVYYAADFDLDNMGAHVEAEIPFTHTTQPQTNLKISYTYIKQWRHDKQPIYKSSYAGEYLRHKLTMQLTHPIYGPFSACWNMRLCDRKGAYEVYSNTQPTGILHSYSPYVVLDARVQCTLPHIVLWVSGENLTNKRYYDLGNIPQPGICILGGIRWTI